MILSGQHIKDPYALLARKPPGLLVDVGAAAGIMSERMLKHSPLSRVIAFEPFPGNIRIFKSRIQDKRITLIEKAASDRSGISQFTVPSTHSGKIPHVGEVTNYSSNGHLGEGRGETISVETVPLSQVIDERIRFLKIDVQGGEAAVLRGANPIIKNHGIDTMLVEFSGQMEILLFLLGRGYELYDTPYLFIPQKGEPEGWEWINRGTTLSSGKVAYYGWPKNRPAEPRAYSDFFYSIRKEYGYCQTDLIALI